MATMLLHCVIFMFLGRFATKPTPPTLYVGHTATCFKSHLPVLLSLLCSVTQLVPGAYERREAARRSVKLPYIVCPILCRISRPEFWLKTRLIR